MAAIEWLPDARQDLVRLYEFILPHSQDAATRAISTILEAIDYLADFPEAGRPWEPATDFRELPIKFGVKGYVARYRIIDERVIIVRVWHSLEDRVSSFSDGDQ